MLSDEFVADLSLKILHHEPPLAHQLYCFSRLLGRDVT